MKKVLLLTALLFSAVAGSVAVAEIIALPDGSFMVNESIQKPVRGSAQDDVLQQFGEPQLRHAPVGQPAISSWQYATFEVYFENGVVIHAVAR